MQLHIAQTHSKGGQVDGALCGVVTTAADKQCGVKHDCWVATAWLGTSWDSCHGLSTLPSCESNLGPSVLTYVHHPCGGARQRGFGEASCVFEDPLAAALGGKLPVTGAALGHVDRQVLSQRAQGQVAADEQLCCMHEVARDAVAQEQQGGGGRAEELACLIRFEPFKSACTRQHESAVHGGAQGIAHALQRGQAAAAALSWHGLIRRGAGAGDGVTLVTTTTGAGMLEQRHVEGGVEHGPEQPLCLLESTDVQRGFAATRVIGT